MRNRIAVIIAVIIAVVALAATPAFGWGNGPGATSHDGNGYGTHDWALEHAIVMAGDSATWVDVEAALLASDDPDYSSDAGTTKHMYKNSGPMQGGPQAVADEYYKVMTFYAAGDYTSASRALGRMSHYFLDICQPYHTDIRGTSSRNARHFPYEVQVARMTTSYTSMSEWLHARARANVADVRHKAVGAALYARSKYEGIDASYRDGGLSKGHYAYTNTGYVLNRGTNDLADIICAVPRGDGLAKTPATMRQTMQVMAYHFPRRGADRGDSIRTEVVCLDDVGQPMRGLAVTFTWPLPGGPKSIVAYTDGHGLAYNWQAPGSDLPLMQMRTVTSRTVQSGKPADASTWYVPTPELADSAAGMKTSVATTRPRCGTTLRARTRVRDRAGHPVAGLRITYSWCLKSGVVRNSAITNANGYAYTSQKIGSSSRGSRVWLRSRTYAGRHTRNSRASFIPH